MKPSDENILADIDATLDQLIQNADVVGKVPMSYLQEVEIDALQKTQESLLARLLHMDDLLGAKKEGKECFQIREKISHFSKLNARLMNSVASRFGAKPKIHRKKAIKSAKAR